MTDAHGQLVFQEGPQPFLGESHSIVCVVGPLVTAVRLGHWVILDELNLAPTEVLEMLNRLLDDNRELVLPETQEVFS